MGIDSFDTKSAPVASDDPQFLARQTSETDLSVLPQPGNALPCLIDPGAISVPKSKDASLAASASSSPPIRFTRFSGGDGSCLTKRFELNRDGEIEKAGQPLFTEGRAETIEINDLGNLRHIIDNLGRHQCIATGVFEHTPCSIAPKDQLDDAALAAGVRSRSKENMVQPTPGLILLDHDPNPDMPEHLRCCTPDELMAKLGKAIAPFRLVGYVGTGSCSAGIETCAGNLSVPGGLHVYVEYAGSDLAKLKDALEVKLWTAGLGYVGFARNGGLLLKTIVDLAVMSPERLIYEARPVLGEGLVQRPRIWHQRPGEILSDDLNVADEEREEYQQRVHEAKTARETQEKARRLETSYIDQQVDALAKHHGVDRTEVKALVPRVDAEYLLKPDHIVEIRGVRLMASELLARGEEFDQTAMPDPIEGRDYGTTTAKFFFNGGIRPCIHSFAHGVNRVYRFEQQRSAVASEPSRPLDPEGFPHVRRNKAGAAYLPATIENLEHLLTQYGITARFNVVKKQLDIVIPGLQGTPENYRATAVTHIVSLAHLNGMSSGQIEAYVAAIGDRHPSNPVADWISSRPWDGEDRLPAIYATLTTREGFPEHLKREVVHRWLLSAVAAATQPRFHSRGVFTVQGPQSIGKSSWVRRLVSDPLLREDVVLLGHHLDVADKDSKVTAVSHWIVELGELDSSFKKDVARLKGFVTATHDKVRRPYGKADSEYPRRTVFCATVNEDTFLVDPTGNSRWWTLPVVKVDYLHQIDMQQLFAQLAVELEQGAQWWLSPDFEQQLEAQNNQHIAASIVEEKVLALLDLDRPADSWTYCSATEVLEKASIRYPQNHQARECGAVLRRLFGPPKKIKGVMKWKIPHINND